MRFQKLVVDGDTYRDVELTFLQHGLVQVKGLRRQLVQARDHQFLFGYPCADPSKYPDWPKELVRTWWDILLGRPGTMEYETFHVVAETHTFVVPVAKLGKGFIREGGTDCD